MDSKTKVRKVAILDYCRNSSWFLSIINEIIELDESATDRSIDIIAFQSERIISDAIIEGYVRFFYKNIEFTFFMDNPIISKKRHDWNQYYKIYSIEQKFLLHGLNRNSFLKHQEPHFYFTLKDTFGDRYQRLCFNMEEAISTDNDDIDIPFFDSLTCKIVSTYRDDKLYDLDAKKFLYLPFISFIKFFYDKGYNYLNFDVDVVKKNLIGTYWIPKYKHKRDKLIERINNKLETENLNNIKVYNQSYPKTISQKYLEYKEELWQVNHSTSYLDYGTSVVNIVFETDFALGEFFTEKTLKALLFSNKTYNIVYKSYKDCIKLKEMGFWFLNFEYIDWDMNPDWVAPSEDMLHESIDKAISEVVRLYKLKRTNNEKYNDYNSVMAELDKKYYDKRMNNHTLVKDYIINPIYKDELLDFLFGDIVDKTELL